MKKWVVYSLAWIALVGAIIYDHFHDKHQDRKFNITCFDHNLAIEAYKYDYGSGGCAKFYSVKTTYQPSIMICGCNLIMEAQK